MKILIYSTITLFFATFSCLAEDAKTSEMFKVLDKNNDGFITKMEASSVNKLVKDWSVIDKDNNGNIEASEFAALRSADAYVTDPQESEHIGAAPTE